MQSSGEIQNLTSSMRLVKLADETPELRSLETTVILGKKAILTAETLLERVPLVSSLGFEKSFLDQILSKLDKDDVTSLHARLEDKRLHKLTLGITASDYSRNNSPCRADSIQEMVKKHLPKDQDVLLVVLVEKMDYIVPCVSAIARAIPLYNRKSRKTQEQRNPTIFIDVIALDQQGTPNIGYLSDLMDAIRMSAYLTDMPASELHSDAYLEHIEKLAAELNIEKLVIRGQELQSKGFGGLWNVGKAAAHPPAFVVLTYTPINVRKTIALVGKGILYDTGGLSIKDRNNMVGMKSDMAGSAAILEAFRVLVKANCQHKIHAILCLAENSVGPESTRPDDVIRLYSGKTVEVNNTDAEGRLVLGDGVAYATMHLSPDIVIDMATLTGAQLIATGKRHGAILSNDEALEKTMFQTGLSSGDLVFPIIYCPEFFKKEFHSEIADMKNSVKDRANGQSSCAGHFIEDHLAADFKGSWIHIDIAGPAFRDDRATGFGVALLVQFLLEKL